MAGNKSTLTQLVASQQNESKSTQILRCYELIHKSETCFLSWAPYQSVMRLKSILQHKNQSIKNKAMIILRSLQLKIYSTMCFTRRNSLSVQRDGIGMHTAEM